MAVLVALWARCPFQAQPAQWPAVGPQVCILVPVSLLTEEQPAGQHGLWVRGHSAGRCGLWAQ